MAEEAARDVGDERQEFLERRATGIGATDAPKILGLSRWGTPLSVYHDKVDPQPDSPSLPAWLGLKLQGVVAELYTAATGRQVRADNRHHRSKEHPEIVCHLDFRVWGNAKRLVECKTKAHMTGFGPDGSSEVPPEIWVQVQHEMFVTGAEWCDVAVLFGHHTFQVHPIARDDAFIALMVPKLVAFWQENVLLRVPPLPIGHALDDRRLRDEHPHGDGTLKAATPEQAKLVERYAATRLNAAQVKVVQEELENRIKQIIGDSDGLTSPFGRVTWKRSKDGEVVDWEQVAVTFQNVIEELLLLAGPGDDPEAVRRLARAQAVFDTAIGLATTTVPGSRRFYFKETHE